MGGRSRQKGASFQTIYPIKTIQAEMSNRGVDFLTAVKILEGTVIYDRRTGGYSPADQQGVSSHDGGAVDTNNTNNDDWGEWD